MSLSKFRSSSATSLFTFAAIPPPSRDSSHKPTFDRLSAIATEERSITFLLKNEFLHQFELLHPSRSIQPRDAPSSQEEVSDAPASIKESAPKESMAEASLVKCSSSVDGAGLSGKSELLPVIEEEELPQRSGKATGEAGTEKVSLECKVCRGWHDSFHRA